MLLFLQSCGKLPSFKIDWKINLNGSAVDLPKSLIIRAEYYPIHASLVKSLIIRTEYYPIHASLVNVTFFNLWLVLKSKEGSLVLLTTGVNRETKCETKSSAFSETFATTLTMTRMDDIFLLIKNRFEIIYRRINLK